MNYNEAQNIMERISINSTYISGEENTKRVMIEPVIELLLGYKIPTDVELEYVADVGIKAGEKVDYVIKVEDKVRIIIEAKDMHESVEDKQYISQLYRYYSVTGADIGIITNGIEWCFYADTQKANVMDLEPVYKMDICNYTENDHNILMGISKCNYTKEVIKVLSEQRENERKKEREALLAEYESVKQINNYINSEQFYDDIIFRCRLGLYPRDKVVDMVKSVLNGSYVLKYVKVEQMQRGKASVNLIDLNENPTKADGLALHSVSYSESDSCIKFKDIKELPARVLELLSREVSFAVFEDIMRRQARVKKWITLQNYENALSVGVISVRGFDIENARTVAEATKRSIQLIKAFKINPIWFVLEE